MQRFAPHQNGLRSASCDKPSLVEENESNFLVQRFPSCEQYTNVGEVNISNKAQHLPWYWFQKFWFRNSFFINDNIRREQMKEIVQIVILAEDGWQCSNSNFEEVFSAAHSKVRNAIASPPSLWKNKTRDSEPNKNLKIWSWKRNGGKQGKERTPAGTTQLQVNVQNALFPVYSIR